MNNAHNSGAVCCTWSHVARRILRVMVLVVTVLCFTTGGFSFPQDADAASKKNTPKVSTGGGHKASGKKTTKKVAGKTVRKRMPVYVRSLMSPEEQAQLRQRGISSGFGTRFFSRKATRMHKGIDIAAPKDSKIVAFNDGKVIFTGVKNGYGKTVIIRQLDGRDALYAHMSEFAVSMGDEIRRGEHIGFVGRTGRATGFHLHFEIIDEGQNLDPALHVWHGSELVLGPGDFNPRAKSEIQVAEPSRRTPSPLN